MCYSGSGRVGLESHHPSGLKCLKHWFFSSGMVTDAPARTHICRASRVLVFFSLLILVLTTDDRTGRLNSACLYTYLIHQVSRLGVLATFFFGTYGDLDMIPCD